MSASLTSKGQITIPKSVRDFLEVDTGDKLEFLLDYENECVHIYVQDYKGSCLACEGKGTFSGSRNKCYLCLGTGEIPKDFQPLHWIHKWQQQFDVSVETSMLNDSTHTEGLYVPLIRTSHPKYTSHEIDHINDALVIYLFLQLVARQKKLGNGEMAVLKDLLKTPLKEKLPLIFMTKDESDD